MRLKEIVFGNHYCRNLDTNDIVKVVAMNPITIHVEIIKGMKSYQKIKNTSIIAFNANDFCLHFEPIYQ